MTDQTQITRYDLTSRNWTAAPVRMAVLSDLHVCRPWTPLDAIDRLIDQVLAEEPDLVLLPGDFLVRRLLGSRAEPATAIAARLARLTAPLGVFASLGNHDWKDCALARASGFAETSVVPAFEDAGIPVLSNRAIALHGGAWLVGLDSQRGHGSTRRPKPKHDPDAAFAAVPADASVILMAHEPDFFLDQDRPVALQVSGHTHGGQVAIFGLRLITPSRHGRQLAYGLQTDGERHLIVSAGVGYSSLPLRFGVPSEIVVARVGPAA